MSFLSEKEVPCPFCHHPNAVETFSIINAQEDPELRELLIGGELNVNDCVSCSKNFVVEDFLMYHDPKRELFAYVYPKNQEDQKIELEKKAKIDFEEFLKGEKSGAVISYEPLILFGTGSLVEILMADEEREIQSDIAVEVSRGKDWLIKKLPPRLARQWGLPLRLPLRPQDGGGFPESLQAGLQALLSENDRLSLYQSALTQAQSHPEKTLEWGKSLK